jgi:hypothetical protein
MVTVPLAEAESDGSLSCITTNSDNDCLHDYPTLVLMGPNLFIRANLFGGLVWPVCPNHMPRGWNKADTKAHVLTKAHGLRGSYYTKDKNIARHRALARNQCWMD